MGTKRNAAQSLLNAVRTAREEMGDVTLARLEALLVVAVEKDLSQREMGDRMRLGKSTVSQIVLNLSPSDALRRPGPGFVKQSIDPMERRRKVINLTPKGERVVRNVVEAMR